VTPSKNNSPAIIATCCVMLDTASSPRAIDFWSVTDTDMLSPFTAAAARGTTGAPGDNRSQAGAMPSIAAKAPQGGSVAVAMKSDDSGSAML